MIKPIAFVASLLVSSAVAAQTVQSNPADVVASVIKLTDQHVLPGWSDKGFAKALGPFLTPSLIAAVTRGSRIASAKQINLYDGEFFTGSQGLVHARLFSSRVVSAQDDSALVSAKIGASDTQDQPTSGGRFTFQIKFIDGSWKIDDFKNDEAYAVKEPSIKALFLDPVRYRR